MAEWVTSETVTQETVVRSQERSMFVSFFWTVLGRTKLIMHRLHILLNRPGGFNVIVQRWALECPDSLAQTEISVIGWIVMKTGSLFMFSSGWIVVTLVILWLSIERHHQVNIKCPMLWFMDQILAELMMFIIKPPLAAVFKVNGLQRASSLHAVNVQFFTGLSETLILLQSGHVRKAQTLQDSAWCWSVFWHGESELICYIF